MKKLITLVLLLGMAGLFNSAYSQGNADSAPAQATANVLEDVTVTQVSDLLFGEVFQGTSSSVPSNEGAQFTVSGDDSKEVILDFALPNHLDEDGTGTAELAISFSTTDAHVSSDGTHGNGANFDPNDPNTYTTGTDAGTSLGTNGSVTVWLGGTVNPTATQTTGTYTGQITLTATYN